ncbi:MAG TPA: Crp/Fnr family transcriptional regulator [Vicinamibacteria bacterium]|nr:Crp/Fnr family transcriptional regulator [Vicinamibacteria bacterium]
MMLGTAVAMDVNRSLSLVSEIRESLDAFGLPARRVRLPRRRLFSLQEGVLSGLHLLIEGRAKLLRFSDGGRVILLDLVDAGDVFGEMSLVGDETMESSTYVEGITDSRVETVSALSMERIVARKPALGLSIARLIGRRRIEIERRLLTQVFERVPLRLARRLLCLAERYGLPEASGGTLLDVALSQQDLANWIGASREMVSLTLSDFRRQGALRSSGRKLVVDVTMLRAIEQGEK